MIDLDSLQRDPKFLRLPLARQAALLSKAKAENGAAAQPTGFQKYFANPATSLASKAIGGALDPLGGTRGFTKPSSTAQGLAKNIVPQTPGQLVKDAAMIGGNMLLPGAPAGAGLLAKGAQVAGRMGLSALGGAGGSALEGKDPVSGAVSGAWQQGLGEAAAPAINLLGRYGAKKVNNLMGSKVGEWITSKVPALRKFDFSNSLGFDRAFRSRAGKVASEFHRDLGEQGARQVAANHLIDMPSLKSGLSSGPYRISFDDALGAIRKLDDTSKWNMNNDSAANLLAKTHRRMAFEARRDLAAGLNKIQPGLGDRFAKSQRTHSIALVLRDVFQKAKDLFPRKGGIDWPTVKELVENDYRDDLERATANTQDVEDLLKILGWGERTTAGDIPGGLRLGAGVHGTHLPGVFVHPQLPSHIGTRPRRIPKIPPALPSLLLGQAGDITDDGSQ